MDGIQSGDERVRGETLEELLTVPLQRLGEIRDLLSTLLSQCSPADRGFPALADATELFTGLLRDSAANGYTGQPNTAMYTSTPSSSNNPLIPSPTRQPPQIPSSTPSSSSFSALSLLGNTSSLLNNQDTNMVSMSNSSSSSTAAALSSAAMPLPGSTLTADLARGDISTDAVLAAQAEADEAVRRLETLERETALKESELSLAQREVARVEQEALMRGRTGNNNINALPPMDEALKKLQSEEAELLSRMRASENRAIFEAFLQRKRELENEESSLTAKLSEHEEALAQVRARLANPPASVLPSDAAKASLYIAWKRALAEREELLRQARKRKHDLLRDLRARHETQVVLLELERRSAVDGLRTAVDAERSKVDAYKKDLATLDASIESARSAMKTFRQEFEQLRVALLVDRMAKSTQVASLADRRHRLAKEAEAFKEAVEAARHRVAAEESDKWNRRLEAEKEAGEKRVADERRLVEQKIERVRQALQERYEQGYKPILANAESAYVAVLSRVGDLQRELESKETELRSTQEAARNLSAAVANATQGNDATALVDAGVVGGYGADGKYRDPTTGEIVPPWKLREFDELKNGVAAMWEQLDVPPEEVTAFLSEADLLAPFAPAVLEMYQDMYKRLTAPEAALALPPPPNANTFSTATKVLKSPVSNNVTSTPATNTQQVHSRQRSLSPVGTSGRGTSASATKRGPTPSGGNNGSTPSTSNTAFRSTSFTSSNRQDDDGAAYLAKMSRSTKPPSLGGPGSARGSARK